jgi:hypothetical protein
VNDLAAHLAGIAAKFATATAAVATGSNPGDGTARVPGPGDRRQLLPPGPAPASGPVALLDTLSDRESGPAPLLHRLRSGDAGIPVMHCPGAGVQHPDFDYSNTRKVCEICGREYHLVLIGPPQEPEPAPD